MRRLNSESGLTLTELAVAMFVASIVAAGAIVWAMAVRSADIRNQEALEIMDQLRYAKTELVAELRFADDVFDPGAGDDDITMYIESNGSEDFQPGVGELIGYRILSDGTLERYTDDVTAQPKVMARYLIPGASSMVLVGENQVDIHFVVDTDSGDVVSPREIKTKVNVRKQNKG